MKPYIVRYTGGFTKRIDASSKADALIKAQQSMPDGECKVARIVPMDAEGKWTSRIRK